ncbi:metallophosphoesterase family protein [Patescibacteria group bacterium]
MKIIVISDSHGNTANLKHVMKFAKELNVAKVIHCGDWDNQASVEVLLSYKIPLYSVLGNADIDPIVDNKLSLESKIYNRNFAGFRLGKRRAGLIHDIKNLPLKINDLDIVFFGHTHKQTDKKINKTRIINPGALEKDISFAVYDTALNKVEFLNL